MRVVLAVLALLLAAPATGGVIDTVETRIDVRRDRAEVKLVLSSAVPWRVGTLADPWRLALDLDGGDFAGLGADALGEGVRWGVVGPDRMRLIVDLPGPMRVTEAAMSSADGTIRVTVTADADAQASLPEESADLDTPPSTREGPLLIALDPGHGGIDPGAQRGLTTEADLMLRFSQEAAAALRRSGHDVVFTRERDEFVSLRGRVNIARAAGADLLISLHADAIESGDASGATIYTHATQDEDALTQELTARQARDDLLMGVVLEGQGDRVAQILVDLALLDTAPRADAFADALAGAIEAAGLPLHKRPRLGADFTVLKSPDIPAVLLELGFMSDPRDLANLRNPVWRRQMADALARAVDTWAVADRANETRRRR
ncbi:N-acetylmuramoyl-L-alanine amidase family protein [Jannaschia aquimarina]|uniref:N-acetylmuramoyl-L-alanine amidase n=1 Tax=Jannaschia aquimarina TaxID=935700 RepID=A0A0D1ECN6_9RHOB|nr:N-acetylmuramoyl-L-alanine amidase [Jannaschia aquimarina]KIT14691.1 N-acetylmuramoyl-L-alanine amidase AmiA precursor [Jannaschia aquimarina]SNT38211.1 N-acetylmuramoyl-L-alanine amidase [Jannaschia aquimarina]